MEMDGGHLFTGYANGTARQWIIASTEALANFRGRRPAIYRHGPSPSPHAIPGTTDDVERTPLRLVISDVQGATDLDVLHIMFVRVRAGIRDSGIIGDPSHGIIRVSARSDYSIWY